MCTHFLLHLSLSFSPLFSLDVAKSELMKMFKEVTSSSEDEEEEEISMSHFYTSLFIHTTSFLHLFSAVEVTDDGKCVLTAFWCAQ